MPTNPTIGELMLALRRKMTGKTQGARLHDELSLSQFDVLWFIFSEGSVPMDAVATHLGIKPPSATSLIATLERKKLIVRTRDTADRRVVNVKLSPAAKRHIATHKKQKERAFESLLSKLSIADRKEFTRLLVLLTAD